MDFYAVYFILFVTIRGKKMKNNCSIWKLLLVIRLLNNLNLIFIAKLFTPKVNMNLSSLYFYFVNVSHTPFMIKYCFILNSIKILLTIECKIR